jgi:hypothetical protein
MSGRSRQLALLVGFGLVLVAVVWWRSGDAPARPNGTSPAGRPSADSATTQPGGTRATDVPTVAMQLLTEPRSEPVDSGRDPFRFDRRRQRVGVAPDGAESGSAPAAVVRPPVPVPVPEDIGPPAPPPPPPILLKFIGIVQKQGDDAKIAVLSDGRGVYHGRAGDVIEGRYKILRVGLDAVELAYVDGRGRQLIRLSGS